MLGSIGVLLAIAQPAPAQDRNAGGNGGMGALRDERFRDQFEHLLLAAATRDYEQGWQLALDLGRPAVPMLRQMLQQEKANVGPRLVLLARETRQIYPMRLRVPMLQRPVEVLSCA